MPGGFHICQSSREKGFPLVYMSQRFLDILVWTKKEIAERFSNKYIRLVYPADWRSGVHYKSDKDEAHHMQGIMICLQGGCSAMSGSGDERSCGQAFGYG